MKYIFILFCALLPTIVFSQAVKKSDIEIALGTGLGIYGTNDNDPGNDTTNERSMAAAGLLNFSFQYAVINNLSVGLLVERNGFLTEKDSSNKGISWNAGLDIQYRLINKEKTLVFAEAFGGYSNFRYDNLSQNEYVTGNGISFQLGIGFKHYFSKTIGMFLQSIYALYPYKKLVDPDNNVLQTGPINDRKDFTIKISGLNLKLGLTFHF